jgi:hypothetical protein
MSASRRAACAQIGAVAWLAMLASSAGAQDTRAFSVGYTSVGPAVGVGGLHGATVAFGGRIEQGVKALPDFGNGVLGIEVSADVYEIPPSSGGTRLRYVPVGVTANYHFILIDRRIDPFVGTGFGYRVSGASNEGDVNEGRQASFLGRAGIRWAITSLLSLYAEAGSGHPRANGGLMLVLR